MIEEYPQSPHCSEGANRRLRQCLCSSAIDAEDRERILLWLTTPTATEARVNNVIRWVRNKAEGHDRSTAPLINRIASLTEKLSYRLDEIERDPSKPIRPILPKSARAIQKKAA